MDGFAGMRPKWPLVMGGLQGMVEFGRGGACVPARVALQGRIHHLFPAHNACVFGMETPLRGRSGGHAGAAPTIPNTHRRSAKMKTKNLVLAVELQGSKQKIWCSQFNCKAQNKKFGARSDAASDKTQKTVLAVTLQAMKRKKQCSQ